MKTIKVVNQKQEAIVDDDCYERLSQFKWYKKGSSVGRTTNSHANQKHVTMAGDVMQNPAQLYDHIDCNPYNNQRSNLRPCTYSQNSANRAKWRKSASKYKGVSWITQNAKWRASICVRRHMIYLGNYTTEEAAARAYNKAALEHFGEFAHLNNFELSPTIVEGEPENKR